MMKDPLCGDRDSTSGKFGHCNKRKEDKMFADTDQLKHLLVGRGGVLTSDGTLLNVVLCGVRSSG